MWTVRSLCTAQIQLCQFKEGRLCSCIFPQTQQFWIGFLNYCTITAPHERLKCQVSIYYLFLWCSSDMQQYSDGASLLLEPTGLNVYHRYLLMHMEKNPYELKMPFINKD